MKVRLELTECAHNETDLMQSMEIKRLVEFNVTNRANTENIDKLAQEQATDLVSESDGFESICGDSVCESYNGSDEDYSDEDVKMKSV